MLIFGLAGGHLCVCVCVRGGGGGLAFRLAVACGVFDGVFLCCPFSHDMSWMRSGTYLGQFLRVFLSTLIGPKCKMYVMFIK